MIFLIIFAVVVSFVLAWLVVKFLPLKLRWLASSVLLILSIILVFLIYKGIMGPIEFNQKKQIEFAEFFKKITPVIEEFVSEKKIDIVLDKKNIFIATKKKDITQEIINIIDSKIK